MAAGMRFLLTAALPPAVSAWACLTHHRRACISHHVYFRELHTQSKTPSWTEQTQDQICIKLPAFRTPMAHCIKPGHDSTSNIVHQLDPHQGIVRQGNGYTHCIAATAACESPEPHKHVNTGMSMCPRAWRAAQCCILASSNIHATYTTTHRQKAIAGQPPAPITA